MTSPKKWFNKTLFRTALADLGFRSNNARHEYEFEPYFQYKIAPREKDYRLYFPKQPSKQRYKNEIFAKMREYNGFDLIKYLDYHYSAYTDKKEFVRFVRYEVLERLKLQVSDSFRKTLEAVFEWVKEQKNNASVLPGLLVSDGDQPAAQSTGVLSIGSPIPASPAPVSPTSANPAPNTASTDTGARSNDDPVGLAPLSVGEEAAYPAVEHTMNSLFGFYAGKIALNNQQHQEKFIQLLLLVHAIKAPGNRTETLFSHFTYTDIAAIMHQVEEWKDQRINTLQKKVTAANVNLRPNDPRVRQLEEALRNFFYQ